MGQGPACSDSVVYTYMMRPLWDGNFGLSDLLRAPGDTATGQIIGRHLNSHLVAGKDADEVHTQLAGDMSQNDVSARNLNLERCVRKSFLNDSFYFNYVLF